MFGRQKVTDGLFTNSGLFEMKIRHLVNCGMAKDGRSNEMWGPGVEG